MSTTTNGIECIHHGLSFVTVDRTQYVCQGWTGSGSVPPSGSKTNTGSFTLLTNSAIVWLWRTNFLLNTETDGQGTLTVGDSWCPPGHQRQDPRRCGRLFGVVRWTGRRASVRWSATRSRFP